MTFVPTRTVAQVLHDQHYLGEVSRGVAWRDEYGVLVIASPTSRRLPMTWVELVRWCLVGVQNGGSRQWSAFVREYRRMRPDVTTVVSYSDPSEGHTGALYRACGWKWAPTWHRLRPPPTGNGSWTSDIAQATKDRWVYELAPDAERAALLAVSDESVMRAMPWASYPGDYKRWMREMSR